MVGCMGDTKFHFRIRQCPSRRPPNTCYMNYNKDCPAALQVDFDYTCVLKGYLYSISLKIPFPVLFNTFFFFQADNAHYYGFVYFRQTKDKSIRRGYFQKVNSIKFL